MHVAFAGVAERRERFLIGGAVVSGDGLFDAIELDRNCALGNALLVCLDRATTSKKTTAIGRHGRTCELGVCRQCTGIRNPTIEGDPVSLAMPES
jgi:hypothetical protein